MIQRLIKIIRDRIHLDRDAVGYFRSLGVKIGEGTIFYGPTKDMFSSEPYLVKIGKNCHITSGVNFIPHDGGALVVRSRHPKLDLVAPIIVGDRCFIGAMSTILAGVTIGDDCIIGAGAVVTKNIPSGSVAVGIPARVIKTTAEYEANAIKKSVETKGLNSADKRARLLEIYKDVLAD